MLNVVSSFFTFDCKYIRSRVFVDSSYVFGAKHQCMSHCGTKRKWLIKSASAKLGNRPAAAISFCNGIAMMRCCCCLSAFFVRFFLPFARPESHIDFIHDERKKNNQMFQNGFFDVFGFWMEFLGVRLPGSAVHKWNQSRRKKYSGRKYLLRTS